MDDPEHKTVQCRQACMKTHSPCLHACDRLCHQDCGSCVRPIDGVQLPCGHTADGIPCCK